MRIYLDNAATTKMSDTAIKAMIPYMNEIYGNPSSLHSVGQEANEALQNARERIAKLLGCEPKEITFTSGGSEADNQAIISAATLGEKKEKSILFPPLLSITPFCIRLKSSKKRALKLRYLTFTKTDLSRQSR